jgi:ketosteroid isomerase-like protein
LKISIEGLQVGSDFAISYGRTQGLVIVKKDSSVREVNDRYVMWLAKENSQWKIKRLMWSPVAD